MGVELVTKGPRDADGNLVRGRHYERADFAEHLLPHGNMGRDLPDTVHVMHMRGLHIAVSDRATVLVTIVPSAFNRRYDRFCSHRQGSRWILHLLHYIPERRGVDFDTIEDVIPLYNVTVSLDAPDDIRSVTLVPKTHISHLLALNSDLFHLCCLAVCVAVAIYLDWIIDVYGAAI